MNMTLEEQIKYVKHILLLGVPTKNDQKTLNAILATLEAVKKYQDGLESTNEH
jgi:hypothetical protein